ncbi:hypothetical protein [Spirillospora sp. CA-294931]|uniref:hypothetical protein n=1 Tax=Spirillospora sp. CA-294931 TaxID=3240042 RepID=UPI003D945790
MIDKGRPSRRLLVAVAGAGGTGLLAAGIWISSADATQSVRQVSATGAPRPSTAPVEPTPSPTWCPTPTRPTEPRPTPTASKPPKPRPSPTKVPTARPTPSKPPKPRPTPTKVRPTPSKPPAATEVPQWEVKPAKPPYRCELDATPSATPVPPEPTVAPTPIPTRPAAAVPPVK